MPSAAVGTVELQRVPQITLPGNIRIDQDGSDGRPAVSITIQNYSRIIKARSYIDNLIS